MNEKSISFDALTSIESATGKMIKRGEESVGVLTLNTKVGPVSLDLDQFDAAYRGFVRCWPAIKPLKDKVVEARRVAVNEAKAAERQAEKDRLAAERKAAAKARDEAKAKAKADKEAKARADKEAKAAKEKAAMAAKVKADAAKLKAAAERKAAKDAAEARDRDV